MALFRSRPFLYTTPITNQDRHFGYNSNVALGLFSGAAFELNLWTRYVLFQVLLAFFMYDLMKAMFIICSDLNHSSVVYRLILS